MAGRASRLSPWQAFASTVTPSWCACAGARSDQSLVRGVRVEGEDLAGNIGGRHQPRFRHTRELEATFSACGFPAARIGRGPDGRRPRGGQARPMRRTYAVTWKEPELPRHAGKLELREQRTEPRGPNKAAARARSSSRTTSFWDCGSPRAGSGSMEGRPSCSSVGRGGTSVWRASAHRAACPRSPTS